MHPGEVIEGRFELLRLAGAGGMGSVFEARDRQSGRRVALKAMLGRAGEQARFLREAETLARIEHPHVVRYVTHGLTEGGALFLVMEWLEGEDLYARLWRGRLTLAETLALGERVAGALGAAHEAGIVHRDIKPSNLFLPEGDLERVKVLDFGIARLALPFELEDAPRPLTATGMAIGTPGYMAPEQARGERQLDARADVFSLGCVLFECLAGRPPFTGAHVMAILAKILLEEAPRLRELAPDVPREVDALVAMMLSKEPSGRPRDGGAVAAALSGRIRASLIPPRMSAPPPSLGSGEQRVLCVLLARRVLAPRASERTLGELETAASAYAPTLLEVAEEENTTQLRPGSETLLRPQGALETLSKIVEAHGGRLDPLADGSVLVTFSGAAAATDEAARAARCALGIREALPGAPMGLSMGRALRTDRGAVGEAIDRAAELAERGTDGVFLDESMAELLRARFEVRNDPRGLWLGGEKPSAEGFRPLLGKVTPFVGRDAELAQLVSLFEACVSEPEARAVLVTGPAGIGKSRLRHELLGRIAQEGAQVEIWTAAGDPVGAGSPFGMVASMLRRAAGILEGEPVGARRDKLRSLVAGSLFERPEDAARVTLFLGELLGAPGLADDPRLRAARQNAQLMGDQLRLAWADLLEARVGAGPLVVVLEDLHWGDRPSVELLDAALYRLEERTLFVLAFARAEVHERFPGLWATRGLQEIRLGELKRRAGERLVRAALGEHVDAALARRLVEHAAGNAFFLEELIRAQAEGAGETLPETVLGMVEARIGRLEPESRRALRAASVFGQDFSAGGLEALLGIAGPELKAFVEGLVQGEFVLRMGTRKFQGEEAYAFRHALVREAAYAMLTEEDRRLGHALAGAWLEEAGETDALVLAEHFERGAEPARALGWFCRAAEQALEGHDFGAVIERVARAERCGAEGEALGTLKRLEAEAQAWLGEPAAAEARAREAMALLPAGHPDWFRCAEHLAVHLVGHGRLAALSELTGAVREALGSAEGEARVQGLVASVRLAAQWFYAGSRDACAALLDFFEGEAARADVPESWGLFAGATRAYAAGNLGDYLPLVTSLVASLDREGDPCRAIGQRNNVGDALLLVGAYPEAERVLREALGEARNLGLAPVVAAIQVNLGQALARQGRLEEARRVGNEAVEAARAHAHGERREGLARAYLAEIELALGELEEAEREARGAIELLGGLPLQAYALAVLTRVLLARSRADIALEHAREAAQIAESLGGLEEGEALVRLMHAETLEAVGRRDEAREVIAEARARLLERAGKIGDHALRASFLENVYEHARTIELARAWVDEDLAGT